MHALEHSCTCIYAPSTLQHAPGTILHAPGTLFLHAPGTMLHAQGTILHAPGTMLTWPLLGSRRFRPQVLQVQNGPFSIAAAWKTRFVTLGPVLGSPGLIWLLLCSRRSWPQVLHGTLLHCCSPEDPLCDPGASDLLGSPGLTRPLLGSRRSKAAGAPGTPPEWPFLHCCKPENPFCDPGASLGLSPETPPEWPFLHCCNPEDQFCDPCKGSQGSLFWALGGVPGLCWALSAAGAPGTPPAWPFLHCCSPEDPFCDQGVFLKVPWLILIHFGIGNPCIWHPNL